MKDFVEVVGYTAFLLGLVFLFTGEPDVWDKLRERAMKGGCAAAATDGGSK